MTSLPEDCLFHSTYIVSVEMLNQTKLAPDEILHHTEKDACQNLVRRLLKDHTTTTQIPGKSTVFIEASAYVLSKEQMQRLISEARAEGAEDALRYAMAGF